LAIGVLGKVSGESAISICIMPLPVAKQMNAVPTTAL
jgi:hypothetical protein